MTLSEVIFPVLTVISLFIASLLSIKLIFQSRRSHRRNNQRSKTMEIDAMMNNSNKGKSISCFVEALKDGEIQYSAWRKQV